MNEEAGEGREAGPTVPPEAVDGLRRLKEVEGTWQKRLEEARTRGEAAVKSARAGRERELQEAHRAAEALGLTGLQVSPSRLPGVEGNQEYFLHAVKPPTVESL